LDFGGCLPGKKIGESGLGSQVARLGLSGNGDGSR
jgi:hypothetical protein